MKEETTTTEGGYARSEEVISPKDDQRVKQYLYKVHVN
jgi:hypothetical protein